MPKRSVSIASSWLNLAAVLLAGSFCGGCTDRAGEAAPATRPPHLDFPPSPSAPARTPSNEQHATVTSVRIFDRHATATRIVLDLDRPVDFSHGYIAARGRRPRRGFIDLEDARLGPEIPTNLPTAGNGVDGIRLVGLGVAGARVILDLQNNASFRLFSLADPFRILVDVETTAEDEDASGRLRVVVLDPGHGGNEYGARHNGLKESTLALDLAQRTATELENRLPDARILLTRRNDQVVPLEERVAFANAANADVFVSIHLNGWTEELERGGVTTFVLDTTNDRQALRLAARENGTSTRDIGELQLLLAGLHRERQLDQSRKLAELVHRGTLDEGRTILRALPDRGVRSAMFYVLVGARMPAILLEASFLSQPEENAALKRRPYRVALARGIANGIIAYARVHHKAN